MPGREIPALVLALIPELILLALRRLRRGRHRRRRRKGPPPWETSLIDIFAVDRGKEPPTVWITQLPCLQGADALLLLTEWQEFADKSPARIKELLAAPVVFDGRNVFAPSVMEAAGFYYESIGRPTARPIAST